MLNYYSFRTHKEYLMAVKEGAKVELEVTGEAYIILPKMAKEIAGRFVWVHHPETLRQAETASGQSDRG